MSHEDFFPLVHSGDDDYVLKEEHISCWITVGNISVYIVRTDEGVAVDLYPQGDKGYDLLATTFAFKHDAQAIIDALEKEKSNRTGKNNPGSD